MNKPQTITNEQADRVIYWLDDRFKVIFNFAVQSGLRISDILSLRVKDLYNPMTVYEKKSKRKRTFAITNELYRQLEFLADYKRPEEYLFESHYKHGVSLHRSTIHRHIKKAARWYKINCSAHSARKLYAQNIFQNTSSVEAVQEALHHQKISTTYTYLDNVQHNPAGSEEPATGCKKKSIFNKILQILRRIKNVITAARHK